MNSKGPLFNGQKFDGVALWTVYYTFEPKKVSFYGRLDMPNYIGDCGAAKSVFSKYYDFLYKHELQHLEHGRTLCFEMETILKTSQSKQDVDAAYTKLMAEAVKKDQQYDIETGHGDTQGACFNAAGCPAGNTLFVDTEDAFKKCLAPVVVVTSTSVAPTSTIDTTTISSPTSSSSSSKPTAASGADSGSPSTNNNNSSDGDQNGARLVLPLIFLFPLLLLQLS